MGAPLIGAVATVIVGLLGLLGARWMSNVQAKTANNEERLSRYESWDRLIENYERDNARLRSDNERLSAENASLRRRVEEWISKGEHG